MALAMYFEPAEFEVPHPPLDIAVFLVVEDAIRTAWQIMHKCPPSGLKLATDDEETINHYLRETLQDQVWNREVVPGFDPQLIACITSAEEVRNFDGKELKKRPDMLVKLVGLPANVRPSQYGVFIECKPVDAKHSLVSQYCKRGITRFVLGRYAWAMQDAIMIGYVTGGDKPVPSLSTAFKATAKTTLATSEPRECHESIASHNVRTVITSHRRTFSYQETNLPAPDITLRHVWMNR
jgi:hypothetical protein